MEISVDAIKSLRDRTSAGVMDCKRALEEARGDLDKAEESLRQKGIASAAKKASRETNQGLIETYIHSGSRIGAMVEINCESDFVARTAEFRSLAHDVAMQVGAMAPQYVDEDDIPEGDGSDPQEISLMQQPYIKDSTKTVQELVSEAVGKLGENIKVRRIARFSLGE